MRNMDLADALIFAIAAAADLAVLAFLRWMRSRRRQRERVTRSLALALRLGHDLLSEKGRSR